MNNDPLYLKLTKQIKQAENDHGALENAREAMNQTFNLTLEQWMSWISSSKKADLYERAVTELPGCIDLWISYFEFKVADYLNLSKEMYKNGELFNEPDQELVENCPTDEIEDFMERALKATAVNVAQGHFIANKIINFHVSKLHQKREDDLVVKVRKLFLSRLETVHLDLETTWSNYSSFETEFDEPNYMKNLQHANQIYAKSRKSLEKIEKFEFQLRDSPLLQYFFEYIKFEKGQKPIDIGRIYSLYQRALVKYPFNDLLFQSFIVFLANHMKFNLNATLERATRQVPTSAAIWCHFMRNNREKSAELYAKAYESISRVDSVTETSSLVFGYASTLDPSQLHQFLSDASSTFVADQAGYASFYSKWIDFTVLSMDYTCAKQFFNNLTKICGHLTAFWIDFIKFERSNKGNAAALFNTAFNRELDDPATLLREYQIFSESLLLFNADLLEFNERSERQLAIQTRLYKDSLKRKAPEAIQVNSEIEYVKIENSNAGNMIQVTSQQPIDAKSVQSSFEKHGKIIDIQKVTEMEYFVEFESADHVKSAVSTLYTDLTVKRCMPVKKVWKFSKGKEFDKIFVSNLPLNTTKQQLRDLFSKCGTIKDIRLVSKPNKCFAYIQFELVEHASKACEMNGFELDSCKLFVAFSDPSKGKAATETTPTMSSTQFIPRSAGRKRKI